MKTSNMFWTDERTERLKALWADGLSASKIADILGDISRNAVLGKVHRLKLPERRSFRMSRVAANRKRVRQPRQKFGAPRPALRVVANPKPPTYQDSAIWEAEPGIPPVPLLEAEDGMCRWPLGDPKQPGFGFCGAHQAPGLSFCDRHARLAFKPARRRRR